MKQRPRATNLPRHWWSGGRSALAARPAFVVVSLTFLLIVVSWRGLLQGELDERAAESALRRERIERLRAIVAAPLPADERRRLETRLERLHQLSWSRAASLRTLLEVGAAARANGTVLIDYRETGRRVTLRSASSTNAAISELTRRLDAAGLKENALCFTKCPERAGVNLYTAAMWFNMADAGFNADLLRVEELIDRPSPDFWVGEELFGPSVLDM